MPEGLVDLVRDRGCVIFRNVVPQAQAEAWESELKDYTSCRRLPGGEPAELVAVVDPASSAESKPSAGSRCYDGHQQAMASFGSHRPC
jgi:hypothetical protein